MCERLTHSLPASCLLPPSISLGVVGRYASSPEVREEGNQVDLFSICGNEQEALDEGNSDSLFYSNGEPVLDTEGRPVTEEEYKAFYNGVMDEIEAGINEERSREGLPPLEETEIYQIGRAHV